MVVVGKGPLWRNGLSDTALVLPVENGVHRPGLRLPPPPDGPGAKRDNRATPSPLNYPPTRATSSVPPERTFGHTNDRRHAPPSLTSVTSAAPPGGTPLPLAGPVRAARPEGVCTFEAELARAARRTWHQLPPADTAAALEAGMFATAAASAERTAHERADQAGDPDGKGYCRENTSDANGSMGVGDAGRAVAADVGAAAATLQRQSLPPSAATPVDWSGFGTVIPVVAGSPGAGASVLATLIADVLQLSQRCALLVDPADPPRSGLAMAARSDGPWRTRPHPQVHIRYSWRAQALVARLETPLPVIAPGMVPPPRFWRPPVRELHTTVVDLGHDPWRVAAHPLTGAGAWLRRGTPHPRPVLVVRPSRPSLLHAEQVLARLDPWVACAAVTTPAQLVVMGAKRWPDGVAGAAGRRVAGLIDDAVFVPHDAELAASGITAAVTPARLRQAITPMLRRWDLLPEPTRKNTRWNTREGS